MKLETERLNLRELQEGDEKDIVKHANDLGVSQYTATMSYPYIEEDAKEFISRSIKKSHENPQDTYNFAIEFEEEVIGCMGVTRINKWTKSCEVGYWLSRYYWKRGLAKEAMNAILKFIFEDLNLNRIQAIVIVENEPSIRLLEKMGFKYEGKKRQSSRTKSTGKFHDTYIYSLLKEDWVKK